VIMNERYATVYQLDYGKKNCIRCLGYVASVFANIFSV